MAGTAPGDTQPEPAAADTQEDGVRLRKELGLLDSVAFNINGIVGTGIFVSPKGVLQSSGSTGLALVVWTLSGMLSLIGAQCYAELGTAIPKSGGDYAYIGSAFGPLPAFLYLWAALLVMVPANNAITALTFAQYLLQPLWPEPPAALVTGIAAFVTCLLTALNCYNVRLATRLQGVFTASKLLALLVIAVVGVYTLAVGKTDHMRDPFADTTSSPGLIALSFYSGLFSYAGWNSVNFITEELKDPYKNLPRAIGISLPVVTLLYILVNLAYFVVLTRDDIVTSDAVAVLFGERTLGVMSWVMPVFVACSTFGALNGAIFASSRCFFVGAREGQLPAAMSLVNVKRLTPVPALVFLCLLTLMLLMIKDVSLLINYDSFIESFFTLLSVMGLLFLRYSKPDLSRPIKVNIVLPIIFVLTCVFLVVLPLYVSPFEVGVGVAIVLLGLPIYFIFIHWQRKPEWFKTFCETFTETCAKVFNCVPESQTDR